MLISAAQLAMLGFVLAILGELTTGRNVFQQVAHAPGKVASVFLLFIVATLIPIIRGVPRRGNAIFTPDAELVNGRWVHIQLTSMQIHTFPARCELGACDAYLHDFGQDKMV